MIVLETDGQRGVEACWMVRKGVRSGEIRVGEIWGLSSRDVGAFGFGDWVVKIAPACLMMYCCLLEMS